MVKKNIQTIDTLNIAKVTSFQSYGNCEIKKLNLLVDEEIKELEFYDCTIENLHIDIHGLYSSGIDYIFEHCNIQNLHISCEISDSKFDEIVNSSKTRRVHIETLCEMFKLCTIHKLNIDTSIFNLSKKERSLKLAVGIVEKMVMFYRCDFIDLFDIVDYAIFGVAKLVDCRLIVSKHNLNFILDTVDKVAYPEKVPGYVYGRNLDNIHYDKFSCLYSGSRRLTIEVEDITHDEYIRLIRDIYALNPIIENISGIDIKLGMTRGEEKVINLDKVCSKLLDTSKIGRLMGYNEDLLLELFNKIKYVDYGEIYRTSKQQNIWWCHYNRDDEVNIKDYCDRLYTMYPDRKSPFWILYRALIVYLGEKVAHDKFIDYLDCGNIELCEENELEFRVIDFIEGNKYYFLHFKLLNKVEVGEHLTHLAVAVEKFTNDCEVYSLTDINGNSSVVTEDEYGDPLDQYRDYREIEKLLADEITFGKKLEIPRI